MKPGMHETLGRCLELLFELARRRFGMTVREMADEAGVTARHVWKYLRAFERAGVRLRKEPRPGRLPRSRTVVYRLVDVRGWVLRRLA